MVLMRPGKEANQEWGGGRKVRIPVSCRRRRRRRSRSKTGSGKRKEICTWHAAAYMSIRSAAVSKVKDKVATAERCRRRALWNHHSHVMLVLWFSELLRSSTPRDSCPEGTPVATGLKFFTIWWFCIAGSKQLEIENFSLIFWSYLKRTHRARLNTRKLPTRWTDGSRASGWFHLEARAFNNSFSSPCRSTAFHLLWLIRFHPRPRA